MRLYGKNDTIDDVLRERRNDVEFVNMLRDTRLPGRFRTDRAAPSSATDVIRGDVLGDYVTDATYIYQLIMVSGALKWNRASHSVGW